MPGGRYQPIATEDLPRFHQAVLTILESIGLSDATASMIETITRAGGKINKQGRLVFPGSLVEKALSGFARGFTLCGQKQDHEMTLVGKNVHMGTGGAAPTIVDLETGRYRDSNLKDLYDAARIVDTLDNIHFFSRPLVARDMPNEALLDINTAYASLKGTSKHVCVAACFGENVKAIAEMCYEIAGSRSAFEAKPFLSMNINHVTPPLRFSGHACDVIQQCALYGIPCLVNVFGQVGASSSVSFPSSVAQSMAESIAGGIFAWLINPETKVIFGPKPMIIDLRTGGMSGGGGEQATIMAAETQLAQYYDLPNTCIAGATDSKIADAQSGYEKCLSVALAAHAGSNMISQAGGMHASLMGCALESYVIDNDMLGSILSSMKPLEVSTDSLCTDSIKQVVNGEGHFLGETETYARMKTDFVYPEIADRRIPEEWEADGSKDIRHTSLGKNQGNSEQPLSQSY